jgi:hypothetical protein
MMPSGVQAPLPPPTLPRGMPNPGTVQPTQRPPSVNLSDSPFLDFQPVQPVQPHRGYWPSRQHRDPETAPVQMSLPHASQHLRQGFSQVPRTRYESGDSRESEVEYILAKQYKSMRTSDRLGFPAFSASKEILGFYHESSTKVGVGRFVPIRYLADEFGPLESMQATEILEEAIATKSAAVHALQDWGSISNLIDHALVYDWSKDIP